MRFRNKFARQGNTAVIHLTQGRVALADWEDMLLLLQHNWHAMYCHGLWYATTNQKNQLGGYTTLGMHQLPGYEAVHHVDGDGLNNRRANLEPMTKSDHHRLHALRA